MLDIDLMVTRHSVFYSPFIALITEGFLEKENLKGEYHVVSPGQSVIKEIASGNIDVGQAAVSHSWSELEKGHKPLLLSINLYLKSLWDNGNLRF